MHYSASHLRQIAQGRWVEILSAAGLCAETLDGRGHACPKCGGRDRFASFAMVADRGAVHCRQCFTRGTIPSPGDGIATLMWLLNVDFATALVWLGQYLGVASQTGSLNSSAVVSPMPQRSSVRPTKRAPHSLVKKMTSLTRDAMMRIQTTQLDQLQNDLGIPLSCFRSLCVGYSSDHRATTWPMRDSDGRITGIRLRSIDASAKWSVRESVAGLFLSRDHKPIGDQLLIVEGASDMAAAIALGLIAIGRPSCRGSAHLVVEYMRRHDFKSAIVMADNDNAGHAGANALAVDLARCGMDTRVISPPTEFSDLRSWHRAGINRSDVLTRPSLAEHPRRAVSTQLSFAFGVGDNATLTPSS